MDADTTNGHAGQGAGHWVTMPEAAVLLGVSERTLRRWIKSGRVRTGKAKVDGRRVVLVERSDRTESDTDRTRRTPDDRQEADDAGRTEGVRHDQAVTGAALAVMSDRAVTLAERRVDELHAELTRARRLGWTGWAAAAAVGVLASVGAVWGVRSIGHAEGRAEAADGARGILAAVVEAERARADRVTARADELADELASVTGQAEAERVRAELLADELVTARLEAARQANRQASVPWIDAADPVGDSVPNP